MKSIAITAKSKIWQVELTEPVFDAARLIIGGALEIVRPARLPRPYCFLCNDDFLALKLPVNPIGSYLYGTDRHGNPICGTILLMKEVEGPDGWELAGLEDAELADMEELLEPLAEEGDAL